MVDYILIVTPIQAFGEMIRRALETTKRFRVVVADSGGEALGEIQQKPFSACVLDSDLTDIPFSDLVRALRKLRPNLRLVIIPAEEADQPGSSSLAEGQAAASAIGGKGGRPPDHSFSRSAAVSELLDTLNQILASPAPAEAPSNPPIAPPIAAAERQLTHLAHPASSPVWLDDVTRAAQHLARLSLETAAQAALIVRPDAPDPQKRLWAYAGHLPQLAAQELAVLVSSYWTRSGDLTRFVQLAATGEEHMLYATRLSDSMVLALVFDSQIPFTKIRPQAMQLARALASAPQSGEATLPLELESFPPSEPLFPDTPDEEALSLPPLLDDVPPPNPHRAGAHSRRAAEGKPWRQPLSLPPETDPGSDDSAISPHGFNPAAAAPPTPGLGESLSRLDPSPIETLIPAPQAGRGRALPEAGLPEAGLPESEADEGRRSTLNPPGSLRPRSLRPRSLRPLRWESLQPNPENTSWPARPALSPASPALVNLAYACILIPRLPQHFLNGDLETRLGEWVPQICLAYGWRLDQLTIQPDYLQWVVNVSPTTSPSYLMRIFRQRTSQSIFGNFSHLGHENPSGDFWAPGYLIMSSTQPPPMQIVTDFIRQTRLYQGVGRSLPR